MALAPHPLWCRKGQASGLAMLSPELALNDQCDAVYCKRGYTLAFPSISDLGVLSLAAQMHEVSSMLPAWEMYAVVARRIGVSLATLAHVAPRNRVSSESLRQFAQHYA